MEFHTLITLYSMNPPGPVPPHVVAFAQPAIGKKQTGKDLNVLAVRGFVIKTFLPYDPEFPEDRCAHYELTHEAGIAIRAYQRKLAREMYRV